MEWVNWSGGVRCSPRVVAAPTRRGGNRRPGAACRGRGAGGARRRLRPLLHAARRDRWHGARSGGAHRGSRRRPGRKSGRDRGRQQDQRDRRAFAGRRPCPCQSGRCRRSGDLRRARHRNARHGAYARQPLDADRRAASRWGRWRDRHGQQGERCRALPGGAGLDGSPRRHRFGDARSRAGLSPARADLAQRYRSLLCRNRLAHRREPPFRVLLAAAAWSSAT